MISDTNFKHSLSLFTGDLTIGKALFLKLENAFLLAAKDDVLEIVSQHENIESDLRSWCKLKGHLFLDKRKIERLFSYRVVKKSDNCFLEKSVEDTPKSKAPKNFGLMPREATGESISPEFGFSLNEKDRLWSQSAKKLYEESKNAQWNATDDIAWDAIPNYAPKIEEAICQIMTYLIENEFSALYIPGKFISSISPYYYEIPLFLASLMNDEARHIEAFTKRAYAKNIGMRYSSSVTQRSLFSLFKEDDFLKSSFLLHVMGEGTFIDLLRFLEEVVQDEATKKLIHLACRDEIRHVAYGMSHVKSAISSNPKRIHALKECAFKRKRYMDESSGESTLLIESLAILAGGEDSIQAYKRGFESVEELKKKMEKNRIKRLVEIGIDEDLAVDISKSHTPNFM